MATGSAARIIRQIIHSTVVQGRWGGEEEAEEKGERKGGRRRKDGFIPILGIASVYEPTTTLHLYVHV